LVVEDKEIPMVMVVEDKEIPMVMVVEDKTMEVNSEFVAVLGMFLLIPQLDLLHQMHLALKEHCHELAKLFEELKKMAF